MHSGEAIQVLVMAGKVNLGGKFKSFSDFMSRLQRVSSEKGRPWPSATLRQSQSLSPRLRYSICGIEFVKAIRIAKAIRLKRGPNEPCGGIGMSGGFMERDFSIFGPEGNGPGPAARPRNHSETQRH